MGFEWPNTSRLVVARYLRDFFRRRGRAIRLFFLGIWPFLVMFLILYLVTGTLFWALENKFGTPVSIWASLYWAVFTFAAMSYGDVVPTIPATQILSVGMIFMTVFLLALVVATFGRRAEAVAHKESLGLLGTPMKDHYLVVGYTPVGRGAVRDLLKQGKQVAVVASQAEDVPNIRALDPSERLFVTYGALAETEMLTRCNISSARAVIVAADDDALSVIVALNARNLAPTARIVVSVNRPELRATIRAAGVTFVASPQDMGGRICASAAFEPEVAAALDELTTVAVGPEFQEYVLPESSPIAGRTFREASSLVRDVSDAILIGYAKPEATGLYKTFLAPNGTDAILPGFAVLLVGRAENTPQLRSWLGVDQGR